MKDQFYSEAIKNVDPNARATVWYNDDGTVDKIDWETPALDADLIEAALDIVYNAYTQVEYKDNRKREYNDSGITIEEMVIALWEKEEGNPVAWNAIQSKRVQIKNKHPKP